MGDKKTRKPEKHCMMARVVSENLRVSYLEHSAGDITNGLLKAPPGDFCLLQREFHRDYYCLYADYQTCPRPKTSENLRPTKTLLENGRSPALLSTRLTAVTKYRHLRDIHQMLL